MSSPRWTHNDVVLFHSHTLTLPLFEPLLLELKRVPIASIVPSAERLTELPLLSPAASPSMSCPRWTHAVPFHTHTLTCPAHTLTCP